MWARIGLACLGLGLTASATAAEGTGDSAKLTLTNDASRPVYCAVLVDGKTRNYLNIRPGKTFTADIHRRRTVQLVCERAKENVYELKLATVNRLVDAERRFVHVVQGESGAE